MRVAPHHRKWVQPRHDEETVWPVSLGWIVVGSILISTWFSIILLLFGEL
ncbi:MAG TPA: hypothetical protein VJ924_08890 [Alphaproteobacteria bacterium]|nr:hypothetical protein [Alphaproteobacteria bacterium]